MTMLLVAAMLAASPEKPLPARFADIRCEDPAARVKLFAPGWDEELTEAVAEGPDSIIAFLVAEVGGLRRSGKLSLAEGDSIEQAVYADPAVKAAIEANVDKSGALMVGIEDLAASSGSADNCRSLVTHLAMLPAIHAARQEARTAIRAAVKAEGAKRGVRAAP